MNNKIFNLNIEDFAKIFGVKKENISKKCIEIINSRDFRYQHFTKNQRDKIILDLLKKIELQKFSLSGEGKTNRWEKGWGEILDNFIESGYNKKSLIPQYNRDGQPIRLFGDYVKTQDGYFENNWVQLLRTFIFDSYFKDKKNIYEFGCGTGYNLLSFAEMQSNKSYYGYDWVPQSEQIINLIRKKLNYKVYGGVFDMFNPDYDLEVENDKSVILTFGAIEQLGKKYDKFLQFMLNKPFCLYVHINSILELYDTKNNISDYIAYKIETNRNYLNGYFTKLKKLEQKGIIRIIKMHRIPLGGLIMDGYSLTVWEKIKK